MRYFLNLLFSSTILTSRKILHLCLRSHVTNRSILGCVWSSVQTNSHFFTGNREECTPKSSWWQSWWRKKLYARTGDNEIKGVTLSLRRLSDM